MRVNTKKKVIDSIDSFIRLSHSEHTDDFVRSKDASILLITTGTARPTRLVAAARAPALRVRVVAGA